MKALILAAGYGNRMKPLTDSCHKTLLPIAGGTIIGRIIEGLVANDVRDFVFVTGYRHDDLVDYITTNFPCISCTFVENKRYRETNNIYSMALAFEQVEFDDEVLLIESDLIYEPAVIERIIKSKHANVALVDHYRSGMDGTVVAVHDSVVTHVIPPHLQDSKFDFSDKYKTLNIYKFSRDFCAHEFKRLLTFYARTIDANCYYELILGILIYMQRETIHAEILQGENWAEVDDPNDLAVAEFIFDKGRRGELLEKSFGGYWNHDILDFCFIRNMHFPTASVLSEMHNNLADLVHNYGSRQSVLNQKLAYLLLCREERLQVLNGASQIYPVLRLRFGEENVLLPDPTFGEYPRVFAKHETYSDRVGIDWLDFGCRLRDVGVAVIVNPNNPTGSIVPTAAIMACAEQHPDKQFIVDESFIDFADQPSIIEILETRPLDNVLVVKSLSKAYGVPGIRLGFVYTSNMDLYRFIQAQTPIWNLNSLAEFYLEILLKQRKGLAESFRLTIADRNEFAANLLTVPYVANVFPSRANFLLVSLRRKGAPSDLVGHLLARHGIYIKEVTNKFVDDSRYLRLAVRTRQENDRLVAAMRSAE